MQVHVLQECQLVPIAAISDAGTTDTWVSTSSLSTAARTQTIQQITGKQFKATSGMCPDAQQGAHHTPHAPRNVVPTTPHNCAVWPCVNLPCCQLPSCYMIPSPHQLSQFDPTPCFTWHVCCSRTQRPRSPVPFLAHPSGRSLWQEKDKKSKAQCSQQQQQPGAGRAQPHAPHV